MYRKGSLIIIVAIAMGRNIVVDRNMVHNMDRPIVVVVVVIVIIVIIVVIIVVIVVIIAVIIVTVVGT